MTKKVQIEARYRLAIALVTALLCGVAIGQDKPKEPAPLVLGAYQIYQSPEYLWIMLDVDHIVNRDAYSEPPTTHRLKCAHVFRVDALGELTSWILPFDDNLSANDNISVLAAIDEDVFVVPEIGESSVQLIARLKPLVTPRRVPTSDVRHELRISENGLGLRSTVLQSNRTKKLFLKRSDVYGMGTSPIDLPEGLISVDAEMTGSRGGWGAMALAVRSTNSQNKWAKVLLDLGKNATPCPVIEEQRREAAESQ